LEVLVIETGISLLDPGGADEVRIDFGRRGARGCGARAISPVYENDILQVFVTHGMVMEGMIHGLKDFGLTVEIDQSDDLFELIKRVKFGFGESLDIAASGLSQSQ
jgi:hypothetical protein